MLQTFTFTGTGRQVNAQASYFRYESGSAGGADESIRVRADGNDLGEYYPGDSVRLPKNCSTWEIAPLNAACTGRVRLGVGDVDSSRLVGNVKVIDQGADKTMAGNQFLLGVIAAAVAGRNSHAGFKNKSSKSIAIKRIQVGTSAAAVLSVTLADNVSGTDYVETAAPVNKSFLASASAARGFTASDLSTLTATRTFMQFNAPAGGLLEVPMTTPIILPPTTVLLVLTNGVNVQTSAVLDMEEL